nr:FctA domain-containing protein [uncultured Acetatifactor sp.]
MKQQKHSRSGRMFRRFFSILLALCMVFTLESPHVVIAEETEIHQHREADCENVLTGNNEEESEKENSPDVETGSIQEDSGDGNVSESPENEGADADVQPEEETDIQEDSGDGNVSESPENEGADADVQPEEETDIQEDSGDGNASESPENDGNPLISEEEQEKIDQVIEMIANVPSREEIEETLEQYREKPEEYAAYISEKKAQIADVYEAYLALEENQRQYVTDVNLLTELEAVLEKTETAFTDQQAAAQVKDRISSIPSAEEMEKALGELENRTEEWYALLMQYKEQIAESCSAYLNLEAGQRCRVSEAEKLLEERQILKGMEDSFLERPAYCEKEEHIHTGKCYDEIYALTCETEEHLHLNACYRIPGVSEADQERIEKVSRLIAAMPACEDILEQMEALGEKAYYEYLINTMTEVTGIYETYLELEEELRGYVVNGELLLQLVEAFQAITEAQILALYNGDYGYHQQWQINSVNTTDHWLHGGKNYPILVYGEGKNVYEILGRDYIESLDGAQDCQWVGVVMQIDNDGTHNTDPYVVTKIINAEEKDNETAHAVFANQRFASGTEFMILFRNELPPVEAGDRGILSFAYWEHSKPTSKSASEGGIGKLVICNNMNPGSKNDNRSELRRLEKEDGIVNTKDLITLNLYEYHTDEINRRTDGGTNNYPFFKSSPGEDGNSLNRRFHYAFGDVIVEDPTDNIAYKADGKNLNAGMPRPELIAINKWKDYSTVTDELQNNYPAVKNGGSLDYLFNQPVNRESIDGLFKYDSATGLYSYDSRENHAEYNSQTNCFELYNSKITPNYIQYPFGNFLPFNKISEAETTRVADIGKDDLLRMAASARQKAMEEAAGSITRRRYEGLADAMAKFIAMMDEKYPDGWEGYDAVNEYKSTWGFDENTEILKSLYNIDYDKAVDFHFGMSMELEFVQPKNGIVKEQDMIYRFAGDDDVWVYIDGKLFLDLSGIHTQVGGEIDFAKGEVRYYGYDSTNMCVDFSKVIISRKFSELGLQDLNLNEKGIFKDYTTHTMNFYYMERGSGSSVCKIEFNLPIMPRNSIAVGKELSTDKQAENWLGNPDFFFRVLKVEDGKKTEIPYFKERTGYKIYDSNFQDTGRTGTVNKDGIFALKAGEYAVFPELDASRGSYYVWELLDTSIYEQYGKVIVDNQTIDLTKDLAEKDKVVEGEKYIGVESEIKDPGDSEHTTFIFNNQAITDKYGQLDIRKTVLGENDAEITDENHVFEFAVTLDGEALKAGSRYMVTDASGRTEERTVAGDKPGIISLKAGETASVRNILAGTLYTVQETRASSEDYAVVYKVNDEGTGESSAAGMILPKKEAGQASVRVEIINRDLMTTRMNIALGGKKVLANPDGKAHEYTFELVELENADGKVKEESAPKTVTVNFAEKDTEKEKTFVFPVISCQAREYFAAETNPNRDPRTFYYKITEKAGTEENTVYDAAVYIVEVTVSMNPETKAMSAAATVRKDGVEIVRDVPLVNGGEVNTQILFTNRMTHDLTIVKETDGEVGMQEFKFRITIEDHDGLSVKGKRFKTIISKADGSTAEGAEVTFDPAGTAAVSVKPGEAVTIRELPYGISWEVEETDAEIYTVSYLINGARMAKADVLAGDRNYGYSAAAQLTDEADTVTFVNRITYELPSTGGPGNTLYTLAGICMMLGACCLYRYMLRERRYRKG